MNPNKFKDYIRFWSKITILSMKVWIIGILIGIENSVECTYHMPKSTISKCPQYIRLIQNLLTKFMIGSIPLCKSIIEIKGEGFQYWTQTNKKRKNKRMRTRMRIRKRWQVMKNFMESRWRKRKREGNGDKSCKCLRKKIIHDYLILISYKHIICIIYIWNEQ